MIDLADFDQARVFNRDAPLDEGDVAVTISLATLQKLVAGVRALRSVGCWRADFPGDTCDFWHVKYGQERCARCSALVDVTDTAGGKDGG